MTGKSKQSQTHSMRTRSSAASSTIDNNDDFKSALSSSDFGGEETSNVSQASHESDPGTSTRPKISARQDTQGESTDAPSTRSRPSPTSSVTGSAISSVSSGSTIRSGNITNKEVVSWILENYEVQTNSNVPRSGIYEHYKYYCTLQQTKPVNSATFGKLIRVAFPEMTTRRLGNRGQSKYQYCNIQRREIPQDKAIQPNTSSHVSSQYHQTQLYQDPATHTETYISHNNARNVSTVQPSAIFSYQGNESTSLSSQQQRTTNDSNNNPISDTRTPDYQSLQLPSPVGFIPASLASSNSPPLVPQHYLSSKELVSIFSPQPTTSNQQDTDVSGASSRTLFSYPSSALSLPTGSETLPLTSVPRRLGDLQGAPNSFDEFSRLYNQHCQDIYNTVCAGEFENLQPIYDHFYLQMPSHYKSMVITTPELTDSIWRWDCNLYDSFITDLLPKVNAPLSNRMASGLNQYTKNLPGYLQSLLADFPTKLRNNKIDVACVFVSKMRRHLTLNHFAMKAELILSQPNLLIEMQRDWQDLDMGTILDHVLWICDCQNDDMTKILKRDVTQLLRNESNLNQWMDWVDRIIERFVPRYPTIHDIHDDETFMKSAKQFILKWRMYTSSVTQQLYLKNVSTLESFKALQFFFDDLILYRVEKRIASVYVNTIQRPSPGNSSTV